MTARTEDARLGIGERILSAHHGTKKRDEEKNAIRAHGVLSIEAPSLVTKCFRCNGTDRDPIPMPRPFAHCHSFIDVYAFYDDVQKYEPE